MPVKRKIVLSVSLLMLIFDIGVGAVAIGAGGQRASAVLQSAAALNGLLSEYARPIPRLTGWR